MNLLLSKPFADQGIVSVRLGSTFRGFGFRIAALTALLVMMVITLLGVVNYSYVSETMRDRVRGEISGELATILGDGKSQSVEAIAKEITRHMRAEGPRTYFYHLVTTQGEHVSGDRWLSSDHLGWASRNTSVTDGRDVEDEKILVLTAPVGMNYRLTVGREVKWIDDVEEELLEILSWTLLGGIALSIMTAFVVNRLLTARIKIISQTASEIMSGDLSQRVPLTGAGDDFDRLSQTLNLMLDRLGALMENLQQVSSDIAHDLRTPLSRLRQGMERARLTAKSVDDYSRAVDSALNEADGLLSTFTALLRIAQIDAGTPRSGFRPVDLSELLASVVEAYELNAIKSERSIESNIPAGVSIPGDRDLLTQLFANLIENAITHTPPGTSITVTLGCRDGMVEAAVADNGRGVPPDERDKIFRRFYRRESSRTTPGTGLGLNLVAAVAGLHDARIDALDNGPGLLVRIRFSTKETS